MPYRTQCVAAYVYLWERCLRAPTKDRVIGRNGERFIGIGDYLGLYPLPVADLVRMKLAIAGTAAWFKAHRVPYLFVLLPDKTTFYQDRLPFWTTWQKGESRYDQFRRCLWESGVDALDMLPELRRAAGGRQLYDPYQDLYHWNGTALSIAYQAIGKRLQAMDPAFDPQSITAQYSVVEYTTKRDSVFYSAAYGRQPTKYIRFVDSGRLLNRTQDLPSLPSRAAEIWKNPILLENASCPAGGLWLLCDSYFMATHCEENPRWVGCILPQAFQVRSFFRNHYELFTLGGARKLLTTVPPTAVVEAMTQWVGRDALLGRVLADCAVGARLQLPVRRTDATGRLVLVAAVNAPAPGTVILRHVQKGQPWTGAPATFIALRQGPNLVHLDVGGPPLTWFDLRLEFPAGFWRFDPIPTDSFGQRVPFGTLVPFTAANALTLTMCGTGWHAPESTGTWTKGPEASLRIQAALQKGQYATVTLYFNLLSLPGAHNHLRLSAGDTILWDGSFPDSQTAATVTFPFPPQLIDDDGGLPLRIESTAHVHADLDPASRDPRRLGVILSGLRVDPVGPTPQQSRE